MWFATKNGFKGSALVALCDIFLVKQITERKAQLARCCFQKILSLKMLVVPMFHSFPMLFTPSLRLTKVSFQTNIINNSFRFAYFTIPLTTMAAGWMGGVELSKIALGR